MCQLQALLSQPRQGHHLPGRGAGSHSPLPGTPEQGRLGSWETMVPSKRHREPRLRPERIARSTQRRQSPRTQSLPGGTRTQASSCLHAQKCCAHPGPSLHPCTRCSDPSLPSLHLHLLCCPIHQTGCPWPPLAWTLLEAIRALGAHGHDQECRVLVAPASAPPPPRSCQGPQLSGRGHTHRRSLQRWSQLTKQKQSKYFTTRQLNLGASAW